MLIGHGCDMNAADFDGWTPLAVAAFHGHVGCVRALVDAGADVTTAVSDCGTAYDKAIAWDHDLCAQLLSSASERAMAGST